jgi:alpha-L-arabinofuranosidase
VVLFHSDDLDADNTLTKPTTIVPQENKQSLTDGRLESVVGPHAFVIYTVKKK